MMRPGPSSGRYWSVKAQVGFGISAISFAAAEICLAIFFKIPRHHWSQLPIALVCFTLGMATTRCPCWKKSIKRDKYDDSEAF
jgi:hypothetical protein